MPARHPISTDIYNPTKPQTLYNRDDGVVTGDVLGKEFDIHYEMDTFGSEFESSK